MSDLFGANPRQRGHDQQPSGDGAHDEGATWQQHRGESVRLVDEDGVEFEGEAVRYIDHDGVEREAVRYVDDDGVEHLDDTGEIAHAEPAAVVPVGAVSHGRPRRRWVGLLVLLVCGVLVGGAAFFGFDQVRQVVGGLSASNDYEGPGSGEVEVVISEGDSGTAIGASLEKAGVVKSATSFVDAVNSSSSGASLQPGTYTLKRQMSAAGALALLQSPASKINIQVRVREGLWKPEVFEAISKETGFTVAQLEEASKNPEVGLPAEAGGDIEGYLFPATYMFDPDVTPVGVLKAMVAKYDEEMTKAQVAPEQRRRVLILASLVQAEASKPDDFAKVARVIENRLAKQPKVPLGFDTTVNFAVQKRGFDLTKADLDVGSPYNTRKVAGLPPGPIDSPGAVAIEAAANPAAGDWLYFVTTDPDTGETLFTSDYNEFLAGKATFNEWYKKQQNG